jgi:hypothetical protein
MSEKKNINKSVKEVKRYRSMIMRDPKQNKTKQKKWKQQQGGKTQQKFSCGTLFSHALASLFRIHGSRLKNASAILLHGAVERGDGEFSHPGDPKKKGRGV